MSKGVKIAGLVALFAVLVVANIALAQSGGGTNPPASQGINLKDLNPLGDCANVGCVATKILDLFTAVATILTSAMVLWGGFQILTAQGDPEKVKSGGKTVLYSAIGLVVVWLSRGIVSIISSIVGGQ